MTSPLKPPTIEDALAGARTGSGIDGLLGDIPVELSVELGRVSMSLREIAGRLEPGAIVPLTKLTGEPLDIRVNNRLVARGEAVAIGERYGVRITEVIHSRTEKSLS